MGGHGSVPLPRYSCCIRPQNPNRCKENHSSTPRAKGHRRNLSAAFNMADMGREMNVDQIDINRATEEELMTLPGINRQTSRNIIEYRKQIGAYKRVEDLALVSGVGATKLTQIRMEICVGRKRSSQNSSPISSKVDLSIQDDVSRSSSKSQVRQPIYNYPKVNINTSNVFQVMKVHGLTQSLAENIVAYRDKKGPFKCVDDLVKVKGIKAALLSAIRPYIILFDVNNTDGVYMNGHATNIPMSQSSHYGVENHHLRTPSQTLSLPARPKSSSILGSQEDLISLYGPIAKKSFRSRKRPVLFRKNGRHVMRIASWNLHRCNLQKAENPGVREVLAMSVLENGLSIVAVQDLKNAEALDKLCQELNAPTTPNVKKWNGHQGTWRASISSHIGGATQTYCGFLYDTSRDIECKSVHVIEHCVHSGKDLDRKPVAAIFKVMELELCVVNMDWEPHQPDTLLEDVLEASTQYTQDKKDVVLLGGFSSHPEIKEFDILRNKGYKSVLIKDNYTDITSVNPDGTKCLSNIWLNPSATSLYTNDHDVIRDGLSNPWIPDGWGWGGVVSTQCPIWAELYIENLHTSSSPVHHGNEDTEDEDFVDAPEESIL